MEPHFVQYTSQASKTRQMTFKQKVGVVESSAFRELIARLRDYNRELEREFKKRDSKSTGIYFERILSIQIHILYAIKTLGVLPLPLWCEAMEEATHLDLPWRLLRAKLEPQESSHTNVDYLRVLALLEDYDASVSDIYYFDEQYECFLINVPKFNVGIFQFGQSFSCRIFVQ